MSHTSINEEVWAGILTCYDSDTFTFPVGGASYACGGSVLEEGASTPWGGKVAERTVLIAFQSSLVTVAQGSRLTYRAQAFDVSLVQSTSENSVTYLTLEPIETTS